MNNKTLANYATHALLNQTLLEVVHFDGKEPFGFPLPVKKNQLSPDGTLMQYYRPLEVLEYVHACLGGEIASRQAKKRISEKKGEA